MLGEIGRLDDVVFIETTQVSSPLAGTADVDGPVPRSSRWRRCPRPTRSTRTGVATLSASPAATADAASTTPRRTPMSPLPGTLDDLPTGETALPGWGEPWGPYERRSTRRSCSATTPSVMPSRCPSNCVTAASSTSVVSTLWRGTRSGAGASSPTLRSSRSSRTDVRCIVGEGVAGLFTHVCVKGRYQHEHRLRPWSQHLGFQGHCRGRPSPGCDHQPTGQRWLEVDVRSRPGEHAARRAWRGTSEPGPPLVPPPALVRTTSPTPDLERLRPSRPRRQEPVRAATPTRRLV